MIAFVFLFPFIVMLGGSLNKMSILVSTPSMWIPTEPTLRNYISIFKESLVLRWFLNSVTISLIPMLTTIFICSAAGYIFAKKIFRGKQIFFWVFMAILMVPSQMTLIPRYIMYSQFNWIDTYWSFLIPGIWSVMFMFLMRQFISTIPDSLLDSANIDGCGDFRIYAEIILPLSKAALATVATLTFINKWNDFINPLIYTSNDSMYNMIAGLTSMLQRIPNFGIQMASAIVTFVPILLIFIFFQKYFTEGIVLAGIKG
jgi:ABC-type glycerol-3-phosphate transport system permease component